MVKSSWRKKRTHTHTVSYPKCTSESWPYRQPSGAGRLNTLLTDIWEELPLKLTAAVEAAAEGGAPTYMEMLKLDWEPAGRQKRRHRVLVGSFKEELLVEVKEQPYT